MADIQALTPHTKLLSLLYVDENQELLLNMTSILLQAFRRVDDASDATAGVSNAKINHYDIVVLDASSTIMSIEQLIANIRRLNPLQKILVTTNNNSDKDILALYKLEVAVLLKPFDTSAILEKLLFISHDISNTQHLELKIKKLDEELVYERKRVGRFMLNEKKLSQK